MFQDCRFTLLLVYRGRGFLMLGAGMALMLGVSWIGFQFSGRQPQTVALDMGLTFIRFLLPVLLILLVQELIAKEVERRLIFASLTYPRSRAIFLMGRVLALIAIALGGLFVMTASLAAWVRFLGVFYEQGSPVDLGCLLFIVTAFNAVDIVVVVSFAVLLAILATVPNIVLLVSLGFMVVARSWSGAIRLLFEDDSIMQSAEQYRSGLSVLRYILPDLGALDIRMVALYSRIEFLSASAQWSLVSALAYAVSLLVLACWIFEHRQFS